MRKNIITVTIITAVCCMLSSVVLADKDADNKAGDPTQTIVKIEGMHCGGCVNKIKSSIMSIEGVKSCDVNLEKKQAIVTGEKDKISDLQLVQAVKKAGFTGQIGDVRAEGEHHSEEGCAGKLKEGQKSAKSCSAGDSKDCIMKSIKKESDKDKK